MSTMTLWRRHTRCQTSGRRCWLTRCSDLPSRCLPQVASRLRDRRSAGGSLSQWVRVGWNEHPHALFSGTAKFFRSRYLANIVEGQGWLPALDGVVDKLTAGGWVADVGCGFGYSTIVMAQAFPASTFVGFDYHRPSIESARKLAADAGVANRVSFEVASAQEFPGTRYDLITCYDCLHDMGDRPAPPTPGNHCR